MYTRKTNEHRGAVKAKARLAAIGFGQREGVDNVESSALTPASACVRLLASIGCEFGLDLCHSDAEEASVQSDLEEDMFLRLRSWHGRLISRVKSLGSEQYLAGACVLRLV